MPKQRPARFDAQAVAGLSRRARLLLHCCCAPCSTSVLECLLPSFDVTAFFYNPNIAPPAEYACRAAELRALLARLGVPLIEGAYQPEDFYAAARGLEAAPEGGERCRACFLLRLRATARLAAAEKFDCFCTTLTVSPHKNAVDINRIGSEVAAEYGAVWLASDFKKQNGFIRSTELSRAYGLYRQNYCGCAFSRQAAALPGEAICERQK